MSTVERTCVLEKGPSGYGFHLHTEKGRPGQFVRLVEPDSSADKAGLRAGDRIIRVCGENVRELPHQQVVARIRASTEQLVLEVERAAEEPEVATNNNNTASDAQIPALLETPAVEKKDLRPRLCSMKKGLNGYGFNLHSDKTQPGQFVRAIDPDSPAEKAGLLPQDRIIEVNGVSMIGKLHSDVVSSIKAGGEETTLLVVDPETDLFFKECGVAPGREHLQGPLPEKIVNGSLEKNVNEDEQENEVTLSSPVYEPEVSTPTEDTPKDVQDSSPKRTLSTEASVDPLLDLNMSLAVAKERAHQKRSQKKAPPMDWNKRKEVFSSL
ncbi:Na(+) H(+) exchange regulatory cofactor NHE-RF1 [Pelobates cultripes]|uniref:Na(+)/H(+) exchange regulatory cofactor NHE-RF n=1 Tax=Pelobates cultripes TaxID=61616 RepID=A0AAD1SIH2_PELCU|nr:Na(+) H(+) exchange regulatory cofactor NHE-RF1 [Pelobates cultripes]